MVFLKTHLDKYTCDAFLNFAKSQSHVNESFVYFKFYQNTIKSDYRNLNVLPDSFSNYLMN